MLHRITAFDAIDQRRLMDIYQESNKENAMEFYRGMPRANAVRRVERDFLEFIRTKFFSGSGRTYWVLEQEHVWVCALRLAVVEQGVLYLEALETHPDYRRRGFAVRLLKGVMEELEKEGPYKLCDCVHKNNEASLKIHEKCGFKIVSQDGLNYLVGTRNSRTYGLQYSWPPPV